MPKCNGLVSIFIIVYILTTALQLLPASPLRNALFDPIRPVILYCGLWQNFILFAPDPPKYNVSMTATITKSNGQTVVWQYDKPDQSNFIELLVKARYHSFGNLYASCYEILRVDFARYIARLHNDSKNPPTKVVLVWNWTEITLPNNEQNAHPLNPAKCVYDVQPDDLR